MIERFYISNKIYFVLKDLFDIKYCVLVLINLNGRKLDKLILLI